MDRILRPERFDADPNCTNASRQFTHWLDTFTFFLESIESLQPNKLRTLANYVSPDVYDHIRECTTYQSAITTLSNLYIKPKNEIFARYALATCRQQTEESLDQFLQKLKSLARDCNFKPVTAEKNQEDAIRDAFITGLHSPVIRQRLLENVSLDLQTAFEQARSLDMAHRQSQSYQLESVFSASAVNLPEPTPATGKPKTPDKNVASTVWNGKCYFCGFSRHNRSVCPARDATCKGCGKKGHYQKVCRSASKNTASLVKNSLSSMSTAAAPSSLSHAVVEVLINNIPLQALVDTGSSDSYISTSIVKRFNWRVIKSRSKISMASTHLTNFTNGHCIVSMKFKDRMYSDIKLSVLTNLCSDVLLGHDFLKLHRSIEIPFPGDCPPLSLCGLLAADVEPPSLFGSNASSLKPIATKSRRHSLEDEKFIQLEIQKLLKDGIIEPSVSPWRAQVLVTTNDNHKRRMVVDYSQTINRYTYLDAYPLPRIDSLIDKISRFSVYTTLDLKSAYHQVPISENERKYTAFEACGSLYHFCRIPFGVTNGVACFQRVIDRIIKDENLNATFAYIDNITICGVTEEEHDSNLRKFYEVAEKYNLTFNENKSIIRSKTIRLLGFEISHETIRPDPDRLQPLRNLPAPTDLKSQQRIVGLFAYYSSWIPNFSDKIHPLVTNRSFPLPPAVHKLFDEIKQEIEKSTVVSIDDSAPLVVETDASDIAIAATLSQNGRPVAFFSRTLSPSERRHSAIEKEAHAVVESTRKWRHYLIGKHFTIITDQRSVSFMFKLDNKSKIKNDKIQRWRVELSCYSFDIVYRQGKENLAADALSRVCSTSSSSSLNLDELHASLCHPGVTRMFHFTRSRNLPFSLDEVKSVTSRCRICAEVKPRFYRSVGTLIKATHPFERLNVDFKGPLPSATNKKYLLTIVDEYSRFPFAFPCADMTAATVIDCFTQLFAVFGMPLYVHSDRGTSFMSYEVKQFLSEKGIATSRTTPYNPQGNGQAERFNGIIWKTIILSSKSKGLPISQWEKTLPDALHSIRSLLCTSTNATPHERLFTYNRKSTSGITLPSWLTTSGPVLLRRSVRSSKYEPLVDEVELINCNPQYAHIRFANGREDTVSLRDLAPSGSPQLALPAQQFTQNVHLPVPIHTVNDPPTQTNDSQNFTQDPRCLPDPTPLFEQQQRTRPYGLRNREA